MKSNRRRVGVEPLRVTCNGKRFFSEAHKRSVVEKCLAPGASVSAIALAHGFNTNLVRKWIRKHQERRAVPAPSGALVPVRVIEAPTPRRRHSRRSGTDKRPAEAASASIAIEIGTARVLLRGRVDSGDLRVVLDALGYWR